MLVGERGECEAFWLSFVEDMSLMKLSILLAISSELNCAWDPARWYWLGDDAVILG